MIRILDCEIAGLHHHVMKDHIRSMEEGDAVDLVREPVNKHDSNAIRVDDGQTGEKLGYVPSSIARVLAPLIDGGYRVVAFIEEKVDYEVYIEILFESKK
ncbi:hypothetical protein LCGC14_0672900 [marine sediment metagenome]|uniref:HIRAN domain-containing protein n=1 Tax=marine sediment metagenome TaxID=412755 RepID=A0A0F9QQJ0_9ZZZZ